VTDQASGHAQADSFVGWVEDDGRVRVFDQYSLVDRTRPPLDTAMTPPGSSDITLLSGFEQDGRTVITIRRPLRTYAYHRKVFLLLTRCRSRDVENDVDILDATQTIAWAYGTDDGVFDTLTGIPTYAQHSSRGTLTANLLDNAVVPQVQTFTSPNGGGKTRLCRAPTL
jgi:hypothetical protein